ncbi:MAG: hypothetical protein SV062_07995 [Thermodesulfobacteriota bacterium]|nr:hypothetical protein [Thermodesulfobacteriota bacterium]
MSIPFILPFSPSDVPDKTNCTLYIPMYNGDFRDYSKNVNHGTSTDITWKRNKYGQGPKFNGSTSYLLLDDGRKILREGTEGVWTLINLNGVAGGKTEIWGSGTKLYLNDGNILPPKISGEFSKDFLEYIDKNILTHFVCAGNSFSGTLPDFSQCASLASFYCYGNSFSGTLPNFSGNNSLQQIKIHNNSFIQVDISDFVDNLWTNRVNLGANGCVITLENNAAPDADAIAKIEGTGAYSGDGLKDAGCTVTYDSP